MKITELEFRRIARKAGGKYYNETVKRAREAESIADELVVWNFFVERIPVDADNQQLRDAAIERIAALKAMEASA